MKHGVHVCVGAMAKMPQPQKRAQSPCGCVGGTETLTTEEGAAWRIEQLRWSRICPQCGKPGFNPWVEKIP